MELPLDFNRDRHIPWTGRESGHNRIPCTNGHSVIRGQTHETSGALWWEAYCAGRTTGKCKSDDTDGKSRQTSLCSIGG